MLLACYEINTNRKLKQFQTWQKWRFYLGRVSKIRAQNLGHGYAKQFCFELWLFYYELLVVTALNTYVNKKKCNSCTYRPRLTMTMAKAINSHIGVSIVPFLVLSVMKELTIGSMGSLLFWRIWALFGSMFSFPGPATHKPLLITKIWTMIFTRPKYIGVGVFKTWFWVLVKSSWKNVNICKTILNHKLFRSDCSILYLALFL